MKTNKMRKTKAIYSELGYSKGVSSYCHLYFVRDSKAGRGAGKLYGEEKGS